MAEKGIVNATVLIVTAAEDQVSLGNLFAQSSWKLVFARDLRETLTALRATPPGVVICDGRLPDGHSWKDLLHKMLEMGDPPPLVVADRLADERLWAEALNLGAYDLLAKPFDAKEVWHAVTTACRRHENERAMVPNQELKETLGCGSKAAASARGAM